MYRQPHIVPRWLTLKGAAIHTGLSERTIENHVRANLVISSNVVMPGATRGRRLVERESLDAFIEQWISGNTDLAINRRRRARKR